MVAELLERPTRRAVKRTKIVNIVLTKVISFPNGDIKIL